MSLESVRAFFASHAPEIAIIELQTSTATVALAAEAHGVEPGQIAKTLAFRIGEQELLVVARGDARMDNRKLKERFGGKAKMLDAETVVALTGHPVGGVCPSAWQRSCRCTATARCSPTTKCCQPPAPSTAPYASARSAWPNWSAPNGWICARCRNRPSMLAWVA